MKKLLRMLYLSAALVGVTPAHADYFTYLCRDHHKLYPVTLVQPGTDSCTGETTSCSITWRGTVWENVKLGEDCRTNYLGTKDGVTIDLCTATQGAAGLTVGDKSYDCQMPRSEMERR